MSRRTFRRVEARRVLPELHEYFLRSVLGVRRITDAGSNERPHEPAVALDAFDDRTGIAGGNTFEYGFVGGHVPVFG
jgi:hypothetical protein